HERQQARRQLYTRYCRETGARTTRTFVAYRTSTDHDRCAPLDLLDNPRRTSRLIASALVAGPSSFSAPQASIVAKSSSDQRVPTNLPTGGRPRDLFAGFTVSFIVALFIYFTIS